MQKKIITYEETEISKELKEKCIKYLKDNPLSFYWNYRDTLSKEQISNMMKSEEAFFELENEIWENSIDYISELENDLINNMKEEFDELEIFDNCDIREEFLDYISVDMDIKGLLRNTQAVNIRIVIHSNYEGVSWTDRENDFDCEYIEQVKNILKGKYEEKSFQAELDNICSSVNQLIFYMKCDVEDLIGIEEKFKNEITIPKNSWCGFFDNWNGSGSVLEIKLTDDITIKKQHGETKHDVVDVVLDDVNKYSVMETYGVCNIPECQISVK